MVTGFVVIPVLLVSEALFVAGYGGLAAAYGGGFGGGVGGYMCGNVQCVTEIQCDSCDYPQPFVQQVSYSRSVLTRVEEYIQSVSRIGINIGQTRMSSQISLPTGFAEMSIKNGMTLVTEINTAIESLNAYVTHQEVGRIAYEVVSSLSDSLSIVRKIVGWCGSVNGGGYFPLPEVIVERPPQVWNRQCVGAWPCTTLTTYVSAQGAQSQYANKFGYAKQYNRGNTQIINSNYDSGNAYGYGDTGAQAQNFNYNTLTSGPGGAPSPYGPLFLGSQRALGENKKNRKSKRKF